MRWVLMSLALGLGACATSPTHEIDVVMGRFPLRATQANLADNIGAYCANTSVRVYSSAEAAPYREQTQIDCHGYGFRGAPRKIELLINEGALGFYWLMLTPGELDAVRADLTARFGAASCETGDYTIFEDAAVALRREPAEILVALSDDFRAITGGCPA